MSLERLKGSLLLIASISALSVVISLPFGCYMRQNSFAEADNGRWYQLGSTSYTTQRALTERPRQRFILESDGSLKSCTRLSSAEEARAYQVIVTVISSAVLMILGFCAVFVLGKQQRLKSHNLHSESLTALYRLLVPPGQTKHDDELNVKSANCNQSSTEVPEPFSTPTDAAMTRCPSCARAYSVPASDCGRRAICKRCGNEFTVILQADVTDVPVIDTSKRNTRQPCGQFGRALSLYLRMFWRRLTTEQAPQQTEWITGGPNESPDKSPDSRQTAQTHGPQDVVGNATVEDDERVAERPKGIDKNVAGILGCCGILAIMWLFCCGGMGITSQSGDHEIFNPSGGNVVGVLRPSDGNRQYAVPSGMSCRVLGEEDGKALVEITDGGPHHGRLYVVDARFLRAE